MDALIILLVVGGALIGTALILRRLSNNNNIEENKSSKRPDFTDEIEDQNPPTKYYEKQNSSSGTAFYIIAGIAFFVAVIYFMKDAVTDITDKSYVGGDAYNYMIASQQSATITLKALLFTLISCTALIAGKITELKNKHQ